MILQLQPLEFIIYCMAVFRLTLLLSVEDGPAWIFRKLRNEIPKKSSAHQGIRCKWCVSVWMSTLVSTYLVGKLSGFDYPPLITLLGDWLILMLALSTGAIIINQQWTKE